MESHEKGDYEQRFIRPDGSTGYYYSTFQGKYDAEGNLISIVGTVLDITERKLAEEKLRLAHQRLRRFVDSNIVGILIADFAGRIVEANDYYLRLIGFTRDELESGKVDWRAITPPEWLPADEQAIRELHEQGACTPYEKEYVRRDGTRVPVLLADALLPGPEEQIAAFALDLTERKAAEAQIQLTLADLERSNKDLEQFAYVASHDLQEPLRMVASYTQLLAQRYEGQLDDKARKFIDYAVDGAVRMQRLINDLLAYSRVNTQGKTFETIDSHAVFGKALQNLSATIEENRAIVSNDDLPMVRADATQLSQLFQNLIGNAIKFRGSEPPRIRVSADDLGREWRFSVRDNGIGIDTQYTDKVFVIFQRLHTRQEYSGTGIGLAICKRIVERHNGRIWFESEPGKGSTFYFTLPK
jgi:PAS domain S-box-containing protein